MGIKPKTANLIANQQIAKEQIANQQIAKEQIANLHLIAIIA